MKQKVKYPSIPTESVLDKDGKYNITSLKAHLSNEAKLSIPDICSLIDRFQIVLSSSAFI